MRTADKVLMGKRMDLNTVKSDHKGLKGLFEVFMRRFKVLMHVTTMLPGYIFASLIFGTALVLPIALFRSMVEWTAEANFWVQCAAYAFTLAFGFFTYGFGMIFVAPTMNFLLRLNLSPWRGPYYSLESFRWYLHNGLTYLVRFTFLEFVTPSPISNLFYQMMGMKIGKGTTINTTWISDPSLIVLGHKVTLGGSVTIVGHYGQGGLLVIAPVKIGNNVTVGLKSSIMGGVEIGDNVKILPHSVVMPKTVIPAGETWGGVPAQRIEVKQIYSQIKKSA